jgi:hypothetical protein
MQRSLFKNFGSGTRQRPRIDDVKEMKEATLNYLAEMEQHSVFFKENAPRTIANFEPSGELVEAKGD